MKLLDIYHEFILASTEEAYIFGSVKHWIHDLKTWQTILTDETRLGRPSIDHPGVRIIK
jgi:hypothetical protein